MTKMICFDMDGTLADLYAVNDWLSKLRNENPSPYLEARPMWDMTALRTSLLSLKNQGWKIRIITWLSKDSSEHYKNLVREAKRAWLKQYDFPFDVFHGVAYGATKADSVRKYADYAILVDDNDSVRNGWHLGDTFNPVGNDLINYLNSLLV